MRLIDPGCRARVTSQRARSLPTSVRRHLLRCQLRRDLHLRLRLLRLSSRVRHRGTTIPAPRHSVRRHRLCPQLHQRRRRLLVRSQALRVPRYVLAFRLRPIVIEIDTYLRLQLNLPRHLHRPSFARRHLPKQLPRAPSRIRSVLLTPPSRYQSPRNSSTPLKPVPKPPLPSLPPRLLCPPARRRSSPGASVRLKQRNRRSRKTRAAALQACPARHLRYPLAHRRSLPGVNARRWRRNKMRKTRRAAARQAFLAESLLLAQVLLSALLRWLQARALLQVLVSQLVRLLLRLRCLILSPRRKRSLLRLLRRRRHRPQLHLKHRTKRIRTIRHRRLRHLLHHPQSLIQLLQYGLSHRSVSVVMRRRKCNLLTLFRSSRLPRTFNRQLPLRLLRPRRRQVAAWSRLCCIHTRSGSRLI